MPGQFQLLVKLESASGALSFHGKLNILCISTICIKSIPEVLDDVNLLKWFSCVSSGMYPMPAFPTYNHSGLCVPFHYRDAELGISFCKAGRGYSFSRALH